MRDKVCSRDLKVLIVCPSESYKSVDRKALADCQLLRDMGGNPNLYCIKGSTLDSKAEALDLPRILFSKSGNKKKRSLALSMDLRKTLMDDWDIVHCYHLNSLWPLAFFLFSKPRISLFLSLNQFFEESFSVRFFSWMLNRVDSIFTFTDCSAQRVVSFFEVPERKVKVTGIGIMSSSHKNCSDIERESGANRVVTFLNDESEINNLKVLCSVLNSLSNQSGEKFLLKVYTFKPIKDFYEYLDLKKSLNLNKEATSVEFSESEVISGPLSFGDCFVSLSFFEPITDLEMESLLSGVPVVFPRTAARQEVIKEYELNSSTYFSQDGRALREAISSSLKDKLLVSTKLAQVHGDEAYISCIHNSYEVSVKKRIRFDQMRKM